MTADARRSRVGSACAPAGDGRGVDPFDLCRQLERDLGELAERARDRAQGDALERFTELGDGRVESFPQLLRAAPRSRAGSELVRELHVASAGTGAVSEADHVCVAQRRGLLLGGLRDRAHAPSEAEIGRCLAAGLERLTPANVGELHLFERDAGISGHDAPFAAGVTVRMWSAIWRGAGVGAKGDAGASVEDELDSATYPGDGSSSRARSRSDRRTRQVRPARTAASRPLLTQDRTVAGCSFNSSLTSATVSHGSSPDVGGLELGSAIQSLRRRRITISKFVIFDNI